MAAYVLIDEFLPILISRRVAPADASSVAELLDGVEHHLTTSYEKVSYVYDAGEAPGGMPDAGARRATGQWLQKHRKLLQSKCVGIDFAFGSPISRAALTAVFWIAQPPVPWTIHPSTTDALSMALERKGLTGRRDLAEMNRAVRRVTR